MKTKVQYLEHLETKLNEYGVQIDLLTVKFEKATGASKLQFSPELMALKAKYNAVREKMQALEQTSTEEWENDLLVRAETAWNAMSYGKVIRN
ncbi:hypothetical protein [Crenothrix polyspora]|uniref:Uncharacterized protein n=1 Tax=Crenothrix polyspora TaxID=360316 RepID=A0A1R4HHX0_9GAMM|nr:hypothetical protein [Crenothrix polyspora]SJM95611.1 hypothetical protein CRENPOLYSF1_740013 [Crenothrix polyspora]